MSEATFFALALQQIEGVGRVTAGRLLRHFSTYDMLLRYPREQVLTRVKGAPNKESLVNKLFDEEAMREQLQEARSRTEQLAQTKVRLLAPPDGDWPPGLEDLPRAHRPVLLYVYGPTGVLREPLVGLTAQPPLSDDPFERAQALARDLAAAGSLPVAGAAHGFDVAMHKVAAGADHPSVAVVGCGLGQVSPNVRPAVTQAMRAGGLMVSPFPMQHGPYDHDETLRVHVLAALCPACVFVAPRPDTSAWEAMEWALDAGRSVFGIEGEHPLPDRAHPIKSDVDTEWVAAAARRSSEHR